MCAALPIYPIHVYIPARIDSNNNNGIGRCSRFINEWPGWKTEVCNWYVNNFVSSSRRTYASTVKVLSMCQIHICLFSTTRPMLNCRSMYQQKSSKLIRKSPNTQTTWQPPTQPWQNHTTDTTGGRGFAECFYTRQRALCTRQRLCRV